MESKERHNCVTVWLFFMLFSYMFLGAYNLANIFNDHRNIPSSLIYGSFVIISLFNIRGCVMLLKGKRYGFYLLVVFSSLAFGISMVHVNVPIAVCNIMVIAICWGVLYVKKNGMAAWTLMDKGIDNKPLQYICYLLGVVLVLSIVAITMTKSKRNNIYVTEGGLTVCEYDNGARYEGMWKGGTPYGFGKMIDSIGNTYIGEWRDGQKEGRGSQMNVDGEMYIGQYIADKKQGEGKLYNNAGLLYSGNFGNNMFNGFGVKYYNIKEKYVGEWKDNYKSGYGTLFTDSILYHGVWDKGELQKSLLPNLVKVYGIDVSKYQSAMLWNGLYILTDGIGCYNPIFKGKYSIPVSFIFVKATQGSTIVDPYYVDFFEKAKNIAYACGAYHIFSSLSSPVEQAKNYISTVRLSKGDLPPVLDIERNVAEAMPLDTLREKMKIWLDIVERHYHVKPIIYVGDHVKKEFLFHPDFDSYPHWIARYTDNKNELIYSEWKFWQFTESGRLNNYNPIDIDLFNGDYKSFVDYVEKNGVQ